MKVGQRIKIALHDFETKSWGPKNYFGRTYNALSITVPREISIGAAALFNVGLKQLVLQNEHYKKYRFTTSEEGFYIHLMTQENEETVPSAFLIDLEQSIHQFVVTLMNNWTYIDAPNNTVIAEHPFEESCDTLEILLREYALSKDLSNSLKISSKSWGEHIKILGPRDVVTTFIQEILQNISPLLQMLPEEQVLMLQDLAVKQYAKSYFFPQFLTSSIPEHLKCKIEEATWTRLESVEDVRPFAGRIILFKVKGPFTTSSYPFDEQHKDIKIGLIRERSQFFGPDGDEAYYQIRILIHQHDVSSSHVLKASSMKYKDFKARLPTLSELEQIDQIISRCPVQLSYGHDSRSIRSVLIKQCADLQMTLDFAQVSESQFDSYKKLM